ncbi:LytR/AlgR family response regulator transcription factor [Flavilitoribacter nigricans]|nr:LytTR family DNA-binding domain-containing protein [Flavilitoribacter nigricans]
MTLKHFIISFFILLNLVLGYLFQQATDYRCFMELMIVAATGLVFWLAASGWTARTASRWKPMGPFGHFAIQMGIGLSAGVLNMLISSGILFLMVIGSADCADTVFGFLNGTFTNNLTVHLLCYCSLVFVDTKPVADSDTAVPPDVPPPILLTSGNKTYPCTWQNISYIETSNNCIILHTDNGNFVLYQSMKSFLAAYEDTAIRRVHRSFAVNMEQVAYFEKNKNGDGWLTLHNGTRVKFSRSYCGEFM